MSVTEAQQRLVAEHGRPHVQRRPRRHPERWFAHLGLLIVCAGFVLPFAWMLSTSFKRLEDTARFPPKWVPDPFMAENYVTVLQHPKMNFLLFTRNTLVVATLAVIGTTLSSAVVAYGFAKVRFKGRGALFGIMLSTMMIPFPVIMVSMFAIFRWMGDVRIGDWQVFGQWLGTYKPLWVPAWFGSAFSIFLLRQFFLTIPDELSEAARIDGCSEFGIFWRIVLPLSRPALAVVALFTFLWTWNDFLGPLVYLQSQDQYTLSLGLQTFQSMHGGTEYHLLMAASVLVILPVIVLFFMTQKTFIQGIATTGVKG